MGREIHKKTGLDGTSLLESVLHIPENILKASLYPLSQNLIFNLNISHVICINLRWCEEIIRRYKSKDLKVCMNDF